MGRRLTPGLAALLVAGCGYVTIAPTNTPEATADQFISALAARECSAALEVSVVGFWLAETEAEAVANCEIVIPTFPAVLSHDGWGALYGGEEPFLPDATVAFTVTTPDGPAIWLVSLAQIPDGWVVVSLSGPEPPSTGASTTAAPVPTSTPPSATGGCEVSVTGDVTESWTGPDDLSAFTSDYWYTEEELRQQFDFLGLGAERTFEDLTAAGEPVFTFFLFNCSGPGGELVSAFVSDATRRSDLPMGPGEYVIASGGLLGAADAAPAEFSVILGISDVETVWATEGGTFTIESWDGESVRGSFAFAASEVLTETPRSVSVTGTFTVTCQASVSC